MTKVITIDKYVITFLRFQVVSIRCPCSFNSNLKTLLEMASLIRQIFTKLNIPSQFKTQNVIFKSLSAPSLVSGSHRLYSNQPTPYEVIDPDAQKNVNQEIFQQVNNQVESKNQGRLFAVVHVAGKQFKITDGDVIVIEGYWPPDVGDKITLDKVLLAGAANFTLIGQPIVQKGLVKIEATKRRKQYMRINFYRIPQTFLRINSVEIVGELNNPPEVRGLETAIF
ncbi:hypothetical protein NQ317_001973 [Molorchus minor]|uniref:Large ribosomal subunit protein bL21m n=1 Tax=Molorchus minor TaxID=1323400 RepID=A0ABQ9IVS0_9CUCU|nr:hypothetical protein NQ317_001973 [Molorchus minor]